MLQIGCSTQNGVNVDIRERDAVEAHAEALSYHIEAGQVWECDVRFEEVTKQTAATGVKGGSIKVVVIFIKVDPNVFDMLRRKAI